MKKKAKMLNKENVIGDQWAETPIQSECRII